MWEQIEQHGTPSLSLTELLAAILRIGDQKTDAYGVAQRLVNHFGTLGELGRCDYADLIHVHGLQPAQAAQILAAIELGRRLMSHPENSRPVIKTSADAAQLLLVHMEALKQEQLRVVLLNSHREVIAIPTVYIGSLNATIVRPAEVFREAIARNCASIILAHNHPSGDATPSAADVTLTQELIQAGRILDIVVLDHIVLGHGEWISMRDIGIEFR